MAEYGLFMEIATIKGDVQQGGPVGSLDILSMSTSAGAMFAEGAMGLEQNGTVDQSSITVSLRSGPWTGKIFSALMRHEELGQVTISQTALKVKEGGKGTAGKQFTMVLKGAVFSSVNDSWSDNGDEMISCTLEMDQITWTFGEGEAAKVADYDIANRTKPGGAK